MDVTKVGTDLFNAAVNLDFCCVCKPREINNKRTLAVQRMQIGSVVSVNYDSHAAFIAGVLASEG